MNSITGLRRIYKGPNEETLRQLKVPTEMIFKANGVLKDIKIMIDPLKDIELIDNKLKVDVKNNIHHVEYDPKKEDGWIYFYVEF